MYAFSTSTEGAWNLILMAGSWGSGARCLRPPPRLALGILSAAMGGGVFYRTGLHLTPELRLQLQNRTTLRVWENRLPPRVYLVGVRGGSSEKAETPPGPGTSISGDTLT
eukprot:gene12404-biopygen4938